MTVGGSVWKSEAIWEMPGVNIEEARGERTGWVGLVGRWGVKGGGGGGRTSHRCDDGDVEEFAGAGPLARVLGVVFCEGDEDLGGGWGVSGIIWVIVGGGVGCEGRVFGVWVRVEWSGLELRR